MKISAVLCFLCLFYTPLLAQQKPNIVLIYADDLGYGDLSCYGARSLNTPHLDALAAKGIRFKNAHATSATCTPSRYALMTGNFPWKREGTGILPGDAAMILPEAQLNLANLLQSAGYRTGVVGKWHLGLGNQIEKDWNQKITPGPNERGFDYSFIFPATADRVPNVFLENGRVLGLDPKDPIQVNYQQAIGAEPTGKSHPDLLKMSHSPNHGHDQTIVNGIGRIGYMTGGKTARWTDEEMPLNFMAKALEFIEQKDKKPFFLFYALTEPHVPRMPSTMFKGKSGLGFRGDAILQLDWTVGQVMKTLKALGLERNTLIIFSSDNGPVLDDGYQDGAVVMNGKHQAAGPLRGGKYSLYEGGTRVPMLVAWPARIPAGGVSHARISQIDLLASIAALIGKPLGSKFKKDSENLLPALLGQSQVGRKLLPKQGMRTLSLTMGDWKYIPAYPGPALNVLTNTELGNAAHPQLYHLKKDLGEQHNVADQNPEVLKIMESKLNLLR